MTHEQVMKTMGEWFGIIGKSDAFSNDRDSEHRRHRKEKGREVRDCEFGQKEDKEDEPV